MTSELEAKLHSFVSEQTSNEQKYKEWMDGLSPEQIEKLADKIHPYSTTIPSGFTDRTVSFSYTNMTMEYTRKLVTTSMIGFMYRMLHEHQIPDEVQPIDIDDYIKNPAIATIPTVITDPKLIEKYNKYHESLNMRVSMKKFLDSLFQYNPNKHAAAGYSGNVKDPSRRRPLTKATAIASKVNNTVRRVEKKSYEPDLKDLQPNAELSETELTVFEHIPPRDTFARFDRYLSEHYEELNRCVNDIYGLTLDIDIAINVYDVHKDKKAAEDFRSKYAERVIADIININTNDWALLGPFRKNRERVNFYTRQTEVLKAMLDQREKDSHIATDIMKKRAKLKKKENTAEFGPDDPEFKEWVKNNRPGVSKMGAEPITDPETSPPDDYDKDLVEVDVFTIAEGGAKMRVDKIYNPVEAPNSQGGKPG